MWGLAGQREFDLGANRVFAKPDGMRLGLLHDNAKKIGQAGLIGHLDSPPQPRDRGEAHAAQLRIDDVQPDQEYERDGAMAEPRKIMIVGAAGKIGTQLARLLPNELGAERSRDRYKLILADRLPLAPDVEGELAAGFIELDITDLERYEAACRGINTVVHLAADRRDDAPWESLLPENVVGAYHAFEAARRAGCQRVIFASSVHAVGGYSRGVVIKTDMPAAPVNLYGATKVWGESLARVYSVAHGLSCLCVRIGWAGSRTDAKKLANPDGPAVYLTYEDAARLFAACIDAPDDVRFGIFHAASDNRVPRLDISQTRMVLGYTPQDDGYALAEQLTEASPPERESS